MQSLLQSYQQAFYYIQLPTQVISVKVGQKQTLNAKLLQLNADDIAVILSADNPGSRQLSAHQNQHRRTQLHDACQDHGFNYLPSISGDQQGQWPNEYGVCLLAKHTKLPLIEQVAHQFGQLAFVLIAAQNIAQLYICTDNNTYKTML